MTELVITRGIPASGKTTWARAWVAEDEPNRARINRDDLRQSLYSRDAPLPYELEEALTVAQHAAVHALLQAGKSVVVDDMHLRAKYVKPWIDMAAETGADIRVQSFADVGLATCLRRDEEREAAGGRRVGEKFIREAHMRLKGSGEIDLSRKPERGSYRYWPNASLPAAWMFDIDGTLALMAGRGPFEWHRVGEDLPNPAVVEALQTFAIHYGIILLSGRDEVCRVQTEDWLAKHVGNVGWKLFMRPEGDNRKDSIVKLELFTQHVEPFWRVKGVYDDRDQVVALWRSIGLTCFQVAPGAF